MKGLWQESCAGMKTFYGTTGVTGPTHTGAGASRTHRAAPARRARTPVRQSPAPTSRARVAVYDQAASAPRVVDVDPAPVGEYIDGLASLVHRLASEQGGRIPYTVIREITENLIHAHFTDPVISILDHGDTVRFADRGPGISDKNKAVQPGFTTATAEMRSFIRGVGSGLPIVNEFLSLAGGRLSVEDNLGCGTVVTISLSRRAQAPAGRSGPCPSPLPESTGTLWHDGATGLGHGEEGGEPSVSGVPALTARQKQVLALVMDAGVAGPSLVARELGVGVSTAYRDLASLEEHGLVEAEGGKRRLSQRGIDYVRTRLGAS